MTVPSLRRRRRKWEVRMTRRTGNDSMTLKRALLLAVMASTIDCGKTSPAAPTSAVVSATIAGPTTVAPGASVQLTMSAKHADGTVEDVTRQAIWSASDPNVLRVTSGRVDGISDGEAI